MRAKTARSAGARDPGGDALLVQGLQTKRDFIISHVLLRDPIGQLIEDGQRGRFVRMGSYVGKKREPRWLWHAIDYRSGHVLAYVLGRRKAADCWAVTEPGAVGHRLLRQHDVDVTLTYRLTMLRNAKDDNWVPTVMEPKMARFPTSAVGRVSLYRCHERMRWEKVDWFTPVILAIEAFETLRANNQL